MTTTPPDLMDHAVENAFNTLLAIPIVRTKS